MERSCIIEFTEYELNFVSSILITYEKIVGEKMPGSLWNKLVEAEKQIRTESKQSVKT